MSGALDEYDPPPPDTVAHIVVDGVVVNSIAATLAEAQAAHPEAACLDAADYAGGIGWTWDGTTLSEPPA
jgi:hypothetical protein